MAELGSANGYEFEGSNVSGALRFVSTGGAPLGSMTVDGADATGIVVREDDNLGWVATAQLDAVPDLYTRSVTVVLPHVNVDREGEPFDALAVVVRHATSIGGPASVKGALESFDVRPINGRASVVRG